MKAEPAAPDPAAADPFTQLGLPQRMALDPAALERAYFAAQRLYHPDRFAGRPAAERAEVIAAAATLNAAYEVLQTPLGRARALLKAAGRNPLAEDGRTVSDPALLMEAMELREALEEVGDAAGHAAFAAQVAGLIETCVARLDEAFAANSLDKAEHETLRLSYLDKLQGEARRAARRAQSQD
ncbi:Fe-S protein assembly co-chaperone HscB [Zavarzinia sp. CC-PAN008]|uniref:Fe-S protein assembly co-chaperone HscB n=1 Tax=Zavarzinia sp. CC-PAN008 TaxID=3243332 RepID=UPI003F742CA0